MLIAFMGVHMNAQEDSKMMESLKKPLDVTVTETSVKFQKETIKAFTVYIHADAKKVEKKWKEVYGAKYACEFEKEKGAFIARNIKMSDITNESVNLIGMIEEDESGCKLDVAVDLGTAYITEKTHSTESSKIKNSVKNFTNDFYVGWYDSVIADERKDFEKSEKEHSKLIKEGEKLTKSIEGQNGKITKAEETIVKSEQQIADLKLKMEELKVDIENYRTEITKLETDIENNIKAAAEQKEKVEKKRAELDKLKSNADRLKTDN